MAREPPGPENAEHFFDRFVHPWLAAATTVGLVTWLVSFLLAATGVIGENLSGYYHSPTLFFASGLVGLLGILILAVCTAIFLVLLARRELGARL
ncbi:MAG: hypothetical protein ABEJ31_13960 [Haloarculaceae archaeon]